MPQPLSRREFVVRSAGTGAVAIFAPQAIADSFAATPADRRHLINGGKFAKGVMSGDPTPTGITLQSFVNDFEGAGQVLVEVASDSGFRKVVAKETIRTSSALGHSVKARVGGLKPGRRYFYRFETKTAQSQVGRFQTAFPADSKEPIRFAFFSCQEFSFGYYNAHKLLAREDVDFVVNLGDYIYSDVNFSPPNGVRDGKFARFAAVSLDEYRERYDVYRNDADLRRMHAKFPMISCWDDHEVQNNYAGGDPNGGAVTSGSSGEFAYTKARRANAYKAFFDRMPTYAMGTSRLYHRARFGKHVDLFVLDERQYRAAQPCGDKLAPACADLGNDRAFLGAQQKAFLSSGLQKSRATWKVIANEVVMMGLKNSSTEYDGFDAWQGYPREREALLQLIRGKRIKDVVFITGDYHAFIAGDVRTAAGQTVATEFVGGSVTAATEPEVSAILKQAGFGTPDNPAFPPAELAKRRAANPWYSELDYVSHGYVVCEASASRFKAQFKKLRTIRSPSTALKPARTYTIRRGHPGV